MFDFLFDPRIIRVVASTSAGKEFVKQGKELASLGGAFVGQAIRSGDSGFLKLGAFLFKDKFVSQVNMWKKSLLSSKLKKDILILQRKVASRKTG